MTPSSRPHESPAMSEQAFTALLQADPGYALGPGFADRVVAQTDRDRRRRAAGAKAQRMSRRAESRSSNRAVAGSGAALLLVAALAGLGILVSGRSTGGAKISDGVVGFVLSDRALPVPVSALWLPALALLVCAWVDAFLAPALSRARRRGTHGPTSSS